MERISGVHQVGFEPTRSCDHQILSLAPWTNSDTDACFNPADSGGGRTRNLGMAPHSRTAFSHRSPTRYPISPQSHKKIFLNITDAVIQENCKCQF